MIDPMTMEIGLCWGTLQNAGLLELIEVAGRYGFPTLSVRPDSVLDCLESGTSEAALRQRLSDAGVRVRVIDALSADLPGMEEMTAAARRANQRLPADESLCFRVAEIVRSPIVNVALFGGQPAPVAALAEAIGQTARRAAQRGLDIVLEFVPGSPIADIRVARTIVETCGAPNCRILLDPWHLVRSGGTVDDVLALPPGMLGAFQLDDRTAPPPGTPYVPMTGRDLPGEGELPLHALTRAALANNPQLTAELEVFSEELRGLSVDAAAARAARATAKWRAGFQEG